MVGTRVSLGFDFSAAASGPEGAESGRLYCTAGNTEEDGAC